VWEVLWKTHFHASYQYKSNNMKKTIFIATILLFAMPLFAQNDDSLPKQWDKTFVISVSHTGSMSGSTSHLTLTYDSCTYVSTSLHDRPKKKKFALTEGDRNAILKKMQDLKVDKIKEGMSIAAQHDGWSDVLCFGGHCIEGGSASEMTETDKNRFLDACRYLEEFADKRKR
jgi:hypothetical protein